MSSTVTADPPVSRWVPRVGMTPVRCQFRYDAADPFAVTLVFPQGGVNPPTWTFARSLLAEGVAGHAGEGDVRVWRVRGESEPAVVAIVLRGNGDSAHLYVPLWAVVDFIAKVDKAVPTGAEDSYPDLDAELEALLRDFDG